MRRVRGVKTRRSRAVEAMSWRGIPVTTVARTLVDIAGDTAEEELKRRVTRRESGIAPPPRHVDAVLARRPRTRGAAALRPILLGDAHLTLSDLEERFLKLLSEAALPLPNINRPAGGRYVDCRWPE